MFNRNNLFGGRAEPPPQESQPRPPQNYQNYSRPQAGTGGGYGGGRDTRMSGGYDDPQPGYGGPMQRAPGGRQAPPSQSMPVRKAAGGQQAMQLRPVKSPAGNAYAFGNLVAVSPLDFREQEDFYLMLNRQYVLTARPFEGCRPGEIGLTDRQRTWARIGLGPNDLVQVEKYEPFSQGEQGYLGSIDVEIGFASKKMTDQAYDQEELEKIFIRTFENQILAPGQILLMDVRNIPLQITVQTAQLVDLTQEKQTEEPPTRTDPGARGILTKQTQMSFFKDPRTGIALKASLRKPAANSIVAPNFKFETLGIGGLDTEFQAIFRKAFASRLFPPGLVERMGIMHVKGILLYGPPGTGKTLIARQIGKMLNAREPKVINGPEVLNKYVGQSEENIRKLFADAEKEYKEKGAESELHIIIFDELDAVCKQRGSGGGGGTGVGDSVVNQLLSKLDGVDQLDNILLIGMTNRKDMIDEALLRAGRLEMHLEIGLPDEYGRVQILNIHTAQMKSNGFMDPDVDIPELARLTKNFSGAEISGLVRAASSFAFSRHIKVGTMASISDDVTDIKVKMQDFRAALEETKPLFGVSEEELTNCITRGIIPYSNSIASIMDLGRTDVSTIRDGVSQSLVTLLHGPPGSGKTALAARLAIDSEFPYIKLVTPHDMIGMSEAMKVSQLDKVFRDADKSPLSIVVIDNIEGLLDWVPIGPRFSNTVLSALKNVLSSDPPKGRRRLVFCTTSERSALANMQLIRYFSGQIAVPNVNSLDELVAVLRQTGTFADRDIQRVRTGLLETIGGDGIGVGIKAVLIALERSRQSSDPPERFLDLIAEAIAQRDSL